MNFYLYWSKGLCSILIESLDLYNFNIYICVTDFVVDLIFQNWSPPGCEKINKCIWPPAGQLFECVWDHWVPSGLVTVNISLSNKLSEVHNNVIISSYIMLIGHETNKEIKIGHLVYLYMELYDKYCNNTSFYKNSKRINICDVIIMLLGKVS